MTSVYKKLFKYTILAVIHDTDSEFLGFFSLDKLTHVKIPTKNCAIINLTQMVIIIDIIS